MDKVSQYSDFSDKDLRALHTELTFKYGRFLSDCSIPSAERRIEKLIPAAAGENERAEELRKVREAVKEILFRQLKEWCLLIFLAMEKNKNWGSPGETRVFMSFCRNIMNIPNNREVTQFDADRFRRILGECDTRNGKKTAGAYLDFINGYHIDLLGMKFHNYELAHINDVFDLLGADYYLFSKSDPYGSRFIFGEKTGIDAGGVKAILLRREFIRSAHFVLSIAAEIADDSTVIRHEACEVIFFNKYQQFFRQSKAELRHAAKHVNSALREKFKEKALAWYGIHKKEDITEAVKEAFIRDIMLDGIIFHEAGHHCSFADLNPVHAAFHNVLASSDHSGGVLLEALADWAPAKGERRGAFARFAELSKTDAGRANAAVYAYLSDAWFVDEQDEFMALMNDVLAALALHTVKPDGSVDFALIEREQHGIYGMLLKRYSDLTRRLLDILYRADYTIPADSGNLYEVAYETVETEVYRMYRNSVNYRPLEQLRLFPPFWINMAGYLKKYSPEGWKQYRAALETEAAGLRQAVLGLVTSNNMQG
ncbi:MAG: hypothetical protein LBP76_12840 [Treponema sp.]|nr:hypothetical protein [Treponema sp.]